MTKNNNDQQDGWDFVLNPYQSSIEEGKSQGHLLGLNVGYNDGRALGHIKALEIGVELGYMRGFAVAALHCQQGNNNGCGFENQEVDRKTLKEPQRRIKRLNDLIAAIDRFPSPKEIFNADVEYNDGLILKSSRTRDLQAKDSEKNLYFPTLSLASQFEETSKIEGGEGSEKKVDILGTLQRIRAMFKTLTVQLKIPHVSLKSIMDNSFYSGEDLVGKNVGSGMRKDGMESKTVEERHDEW